MLGRLKAIPNADSDKTNVYRTRRKKKSNPFKTNLNVKKKFTVVCINSKSSPTVTNSTLTAHQCPL